MPMRVLLVAVAVATVALLAVSGCRGEADDAAAERSAAGEQASTGQESVADVGGKSDGRAIPGNGAMPVGSAMPLGTPDTGSLAAGTADAAAVATWIPRGIQDIDEDEEIAQYVHNLVGTDIVWSEYFVRRTTWDDIEWMTSGGNLDPTPDLSGVPEVPDEQVYWIVGFRSRELIPVERIGSFMGQPSGSRLGQVGPPGTGVYEAFYVLDVAGNIANVGSVDTPTEDGARQPNEKWQIEDIASLREVAR